MVLLSAPFACPPRAAKQQAVRRLWSDWAVDRLPLSEPKYPSALCRGCRVPVAPLTHYKQEAILLLAQKVIFTKTAQQCENSCVILGARDAVATAFQVAAPFELV